ncbi:MAG: hypothetical protein FWD74_03225 [Actinomycetia bacterium]|nr:hypothetical protein [Actinomycetes bacterium]
MSTDLSWQVALRGTDQLPAEPDPLSCGPLSALLAEGEIRELSAAGVELVSHIYVSVRDKNWNTIAPELTVTERTVTGDVVRVALAARNHSDEIDFHWQGAIELTRDGAFSYTMSGRADTDFDYCRIGFCLLFAAEGTAGRPYRAWAGDQSCAGVLPALIEPQRMVDGVEQALFPACAGFELDLPGGLVRTEFEGDLFEMEDQRNWTDASFKMYCTPIALGYPHHARAGQTFHQRITVSTGVQEVAGAPAGERPATLDLAAHPELPRPPIGIGQSSALDRPMTAAEAALVAAMRPDHLRADLHLEADGWAETLARASADSAAIGCPLELAVHLSAADGAAEAASQLAVRLRSVALRRVLVLDADNHGTAMTPPALVSSVRAILRAAGITAPVGGGTNGDFAELNRDRLDVSEADFVAYAMNPQVHVFDDKSVLSTIPTQASTVATARSFCGDTPIAASPVTLRPRFNPAATTPEEMDPVPAPGELPASADARQMSLFAAAWALGSMVSLVGAGTDSLTFFETVGWRGVVERSTDDVPASPFHSTPGMVFPIYHLWRDLTDGIDAEPAGRRCAPILDPVAGLAALTMPVADGRGVALANLRAGPPRQISVAGLSGARVRARILDTACAATAAHRPTEFRDRWQSIQPVDGRVTICLPAYACARLDEPLPVQGAVRGTP